jgi:cellobiose-specific phosphotransferase system component IIC
MKMFMAILAAIAIAYFWDARYNNGRLADGLVSMGQSMSHYMLR